MQAPSFHLALYYGFDGVFLHCSEYFKDGGLNRRVEWLPIPDRFTLTCTKILAHILGEISRFQFLSHERSQQMYQIY